MKKQLFFLSVAFILCLNTQAQITLTQANTSFTPGSMTSVGGDTTGFILPLTGANKQWNYSNLTTNSTSSLNYITPSNANFPTATFADTGSSAPIIPNKYYYYDSYYQTSSSGANSLGFVVNNQRYGIGTLTGNNNDSIIFPTQYCAYSTLSYLMKFPTTMSTSWNTNIRSVLNFQLTVTAYSLNNMPCQKVTNTVRLDTVVGWGTMRIPTLSGPSLAYDVLMIKRTVIQADSFYMAGTPANSTLLGFFGVTQGQTTTTNRYMFWRANARYPLLMVNFGSNNFTKASSVYFDGTAQFDPSGVTEINQNSDISIYPNPNNGNFSLLLNKMINEPYDLKIQNMLGQTVYSQKINPSDIINQEIHADNLNSGTYIVNIISEKKKLTSKLFIR